VPPKSKSERTKIVAENKIYQFYEIEQSKLLLDFEKIALFTKHPGSLGAFREARLRKYLKDLTPGALSVGSGFVSVWDDPNSIYAGVEVKSSLTFFKQYAKKGESHQEYPLGPEEGKFRWAGTMIDAMRNIASLKGICDLIPEVSQGVFFGVFSFNIEFDVHNLYHALDNGEIQLQLGIRHVDELPGLISVPNRVCVLFSGWDMLERSPHHDVTTSFMNVIESVEPNRAYPLQFFSTMFTNQIRSKFSHRTPDVGGLFSMKGVATKISRWHFDLNSEGYEDQ